MQYRILLVTVYTIIVGHACGHNTDTESFHGTFKEHRFLAPGRRFPRSGSGYNYSINPYKRKSFSVCISLCRWRGAKRSLLYNLLYSKHFMAAVLFTVRIQFHLKPVKKEDSPKIYASSQGPCTIMYNCTLNSIV
jgi:hypothetical protein